MRVGKADLSDADARLRKKDRGHIAANGDIQTLLTGQRFNIRLKAVDIDR